jgi:hypothetical protein
VVELACCCPVLIEDLVELLGQLVKYHIDGFKVRGNYFEVPAHGVREGNAE